jgi:hypothetical protein
MIQVATTKVILNAEDLREYEEMQRTRSERRQGAAASPGPTGMHGGVQKQQAQLSSQAQTRLDNQRRIGLKK